MWRGVYLRANLADGAPAWTSLDVDRNYRCLQTGVGVKTVIAQLQAILIFALCPEAAVALVAGANFFVMRLFVSVYIGMDFDHR